MLPAKARSGLSDLYNTASLIPNTSYHGYMPLGISERQPSTHCSGLYPYNLNEPWFGRFSPISQPPGVSCRMQMLVHDVVGAELCLALLEYYSHRDAH